MRFALMVLFGSAGAVVISALNGHATLADLFVLLMAFSPLLMVGQRDLWTLRSGRFCGFSILSAAMGLVVVLMSLVLFPSEWPLLARLISWVLLIASGAAFGHLFRRIGWEHEGYVRVHQAGVEEEKRRQERELESAREQSHLLAEATRDISEVYDLTREIGTSIHMETIVHHIRTALKRIIICERAELLIAARDGVPAHIYDLRTGERKELSQSGLALEQWQWVLRNAQEMKTSTSRVDSRFEEIALEEMLFYHTVLPLTGEGGVYGAVWVATVGFKTRDGMEFNITDELEMGRLHVLAQQAGLALEKAHLYTKVQMMSVTDGLTGLANHSYFQKRFADEWSRSKSRNLPFTVLMIDVDHFKGFNDRYGHNTGDEVLRTVAEMIKGSVRELDFVARYGGEEFVVLSPETDRIGAEVVAKRIRESVEACRVNTEHGELSVTVSVGVAVYPDAGVSGREELLSASDAALYEAKRAGRNCVCFAGAKTL